MLRIRSEQLDAFRRASRTAFIKDMLAHLRGHFPERFAEVGDEELRAKVEKAIDSLEQHDIRDRQSVARFLNVCAVHGWDVLDQNGRQWMQRDFLARASIPPLERVAMLLEELRTREEIEAHNAKLRAEFVPEGEA